jgi:hypothetical protein
MGILLLSLAGCCALLLVVWRISEILIARQRRRAGYVELQDTNLFQRPWADAGEALS